MGNSLREVKAKIVSTKKTSQITNAMYMVSVAKLKRSETKHKNFQDFIKNVEEVVGELVKHEDAMGHPLLRERKVKKTGYLLITSDRGLAGAYNSQVFKQFKEDIKKHKSNDEFTVGALGVKGFSFIRSQGLPTDQTNAIGIRDDVLFVDIHELIDQIINQYVNHEIDELVIYYNHFVSKMEQVVTRKQLLPLDDIESGDKKDYIYEPDISQVLDRLLPIYAENKIYGYILDAKASEHASRMRSMQSATDNASSLINDLNILYNRARQASITQEITEIVAGASSME